MRLLIANHCPFLLSLAISFFYFTLPPKKVKYFLEELYISDIYTKAWKIVVYLHNDFRVGV